MSKEFLWNNFRDKCLIRNLSKLFRELERR